MGVVKGFNYLGFKTYLNEVNNTMVLIQKIKFHLIATTILIGIVFWFWFRLWYISVPFICLGISEIFVKIMILVDRESETMNKCIYFLSFRIFQLYSLNKIYDYTLVKFESGRGQDGTIVSYEVGFFKSERTHEILSFSDEVMRNKIFSMLSKFLLTKHGMSNLE
jgi:hypothetical protein